MSRSNIFALPYRRLSDERGRAALDLWLTTVWHRAVTSEVVVAISLSPDSMTFSEPSQGDLGARAPRLQLHLPPKPVASTASSTSLTVRDAHHDLLQGFLHSLCPSSQYPWSATLWAVENIIKDFREVVRTLLCVGVRALAYADTYGRSPSSCDCAGRRPAQKRASDYLRSSSCRANRCSWTGQAATASSSPSLRLRLSGSRYACMCD